MRVSCVVDELEDGTADLYVDANRNRQIEKRDKIAGAGPDWEIPLDVQVTADWTYVRFHGGSRSHFFEDDELAPWAKRIRDWRDQGIESYSYFNNDTLWHDRPAAIDNARRLREMIGN